MQRHLDDDEKLKGHGSPPDGPDVWAKGVFREVVEPERIVFTDSFANEAGNVVPPAHYGVSSDWPLEAVITVTFAEQSGKTKMTLRHSVLESLAKRTGALQGWTEGLDRLAEELAKTWVFTRQDGDSRRPTYSSNQAPLPPRSGGCRRRPSETSRRSSKRS